MWHRGRPPQASSGLTAPLFRDSHGGLLLVVLFNGSRDGDIDPCLFVLFVTLRALMQYKTGCGCSGQPGDGAWEGEVEPGEEGDPEDEHRYPESHEGRHG